MSTTFGLAEKLASGQSVTIQATGDSTVFGQNDTAMSGWVGRLGVKHGLAFNATVLKQQYGITGTYSAPVTLNTGVGVNQILVRDAGVQGWTTANVNFALSTMLNVANPDVIIHGTGFNDINQGTSPSAYVANIHTFITRAKAACPGVPIIITTENVANSSTYDAAFNALANDLVGQSLPLSPGLIASTTISGVWLMDTRQAYGNVWQSALMQDALHPKAAGYQAQADWMFDLLMAGFGGTAGVAPTITTTSLDTVTQSSAFTQTIAATGTAPITWSVSAGVPPAGLSVNPTTGVVSGTPTTAGAYSFTLRATNAYDHDDQVFTGTVAAASGGGPGPFTSDGVARLNAKLNGHWHRIPLKIKDGGVWKTVVLRH